MSMKISIIKKSAFLWKRSKNVKNLICRDQFWSKNLLWRKSNSAVCASYALDIVSNISSQQEWRKSRTLKPSRSPSYTIYLVVTYFLVITIQQTELSVMNTCKFQKPKALYYYYTSWWSPHRIIVKTFS